MPGEGEMVLMEITVKSPRKSILFIWMQHFQMNRIDFLGFLSLGD